MRVRLLTWAAKKSGYGYGPAHLVPEVPEDGSGLGQLLSQDRGVDSWKNVEEFSECGMVEEELCKSTQELKDG